MSLKFNKVISSSFFKYKIQAKYLEGTNAFKV